MNNSKHLIEDIEYITCPICGFNKHEKLKYLSHNHLKSHNISLEGIRKLYPNIPTMTSKYVDNINEKNKKIVSDNKNKTKQIKCNNPNCSNIIEVNIFSNKKILCNLCKQINIKNDHAIDTSKKSFESHFKNTGYTHPSKNPEIQKKKKLTNLEKRGVNYPLDSPDIRQLAITTRNNNIKNNILNQIKMNDLELLDKEYIDCYFWHKFKCIKCGLEFTQRWNYIQQGLRCPVCYPRNKFSTKPEKEIAEYIKEIGNNIICRDRGIIHPYEIDILIPEKNIAIEHNGIFWHNDNIKDKYYHIRKLEKCLEKNIHLIQIFEDEWYFKKDIVKSRLKHICGDNNLAKKIYGRKCEIREITTIEKNNFLDNNHIQGRDISLIKLGAFYDNELITVMTFSHGKLSKGTTKEEGIFELSRFCSKSDIIPIGVAGKILTYFKNKYMWKEIFSYADRRWSNGGLYYKLGFEYVGNTNPNYWYIKGMKRIHRYSLRKKEEELKIGLTEIELRKREGYTVIWDCGSMKFIMKNG